MKSTTVPILERRAKLYRGSKTIPSPLDKPTTNFNINRDFNAIGSIDFVDKNGNVNAFYPNREI